MSKYYDEKMIASMKEQRRVNTSDEDFIKKEVYENTFVRSVKFVERCYVIGKSGVRLHLPASCKGYNHKKYWNQVFPSLISSIGEGIDIGVSREGNTEHEEVLVITFADVEEK